MASPHHKRGPWSQAEDQTLMNLVHSQGPNNWVRIAQTLGTRTPKQCRERYHQNLKPTLNHGPITPEEGAIIERLVKEIGKRWAEIARRLNGRSDNAVKNWWNGSQNRRKRSDRRKAHSQVTYEAPLQHQQHYNTPRTLPPPSGRPMPLALLPSDSHRYIETPLTSPSVYSPPVYSPGSEGAPSLMSDYGSHYSVSPHPHYEHPVSPEANHLPPLKTRDGIHHSPRSSLSPADNKLPPLSDYLPSSYTTSPEYHRPDGQRRLPPVPPYDAPPYDYFSRPLTQLPTAPNSPTNVGYASQLPPMRVSASAIPSAEERAESTRARVSIGNLLH